MMFSTCFEAEGSSSGRRLYIQVWNRVFYKLKLQKSNILRFYNLTFIRLYLYHNF